MLENWFFISVAIFGGIFGTYTDLTNRWVPDWINYFLILVGIWGHAIVSILQWSIWPVIYSLIGAGLFFAIGALLFYGRAWGGGDAKLLTGFGALVPVFSNNAPWPSLATYFLIV